MSAQDPGDAAGPWCPSGISSRSSAFRCKSECRSRALAKPPERARGAEESWVALSEPLSVLAFRKGLEKTSALKKRLPAVPAWDLHSAAMTPARPLTSSARLQVRGRAEESPAYRLNPRRAY